MYSYLAADSKRMSIKNMGIKITNIGGMYRLGRSYRSKVVTCVVINDGPFIETLRIYTKV